MKGIVSLVLAAGGVTADAMGEQQKSFCEYGFASATTIGAGGAEWVQQWGKAPVDWFRCEARPNVGFLNAGVVGLQRTMTTGAPVIGADLILSLPFQGTIELTAIDEETGEEAGAITGAMNGSFVADLNAAHADITGQTITIRFGAPLHDGPDATIEVSETSGKFKSIRAAGNWQWYVSGTITIARVPALSPQTNIFAALQNSALILEAEEETVLSGSYTRGGR